MVWRLITAAVFFLGAEVAEHTLPWLALALDILAILCAGYDVFIRAVANIFRKRLFDESLLMSVVCIASIIIREAGEGASVMILYQLGELFQGYAVAKVRQNIESLMENRSPETTAILADVRSDNGTHGQTEDFITHFARVYTPVVLLFAFLIAVLSPFIWHISFTAAIHRALVLMVIACPCAIVISVPLTYFAGIGGAVRQGILFKSSCAMDDVSRAGVVVFDKSNTLEGEGLRVTSVKSERIDAQVFLRIAAHACAYAEDPHAEAVKNAYKGVIYIELIQSFQIQGEMCVTVSVDGVQIVLGTADFIRSHGADPGADETEEDSIYMAINGEYAGRILFGSVARPDVPGTVTVLSWEKKRQIAMLTEDSPAATEKFARQVGIGEFYPNCKGEDKIAVVKEIRNRQIKQGKLIFVGDADHSADAIREADVGVSLHGDKSDAAIAAADVVIMGPSPSKVITAIDAARHTRTIVKQNILFALSFKALILILDMLGICPLWLAVFADVGVALLAVLNSLRAFLLREPVIPMEE